MDAMRCRECGDVRWSLTHRDHDGERCELCGGEMVPERRIPGQAAAATPPQERRHGAS